jgi:hypothetical protein
MDVTGDLVMVAGKLGNTFKNSVSMMLRHDEQAWLKR